MANMTWCGLALYPSPLRGGERAWYTLVLTVHAPITTVLWPYLTPSYLRAMWRSLKIFAYGQTRTGSKEICHTQ